MGLAKHIKKIVCANAKLVLLALVFLLPRYAAAQLDKQFWFVAPYVNPEDRQFDRPIVLNITALAAPATVTISMPADPTFTPITANIPANSTVNEDLTPWINQIENTPGNTVLNRGLLITSNANVTAYYDVVSSECNCDPEVFSLKGKNALGTEFFISSQYTYDESTAYASANSFDIVATQNNTHVTITPAQPIIGHPANVPFTIVLNMGQTYSAVAVSTSAGGHLEGSYISSDNPIAITLKDDLVQVSSCADLIGDQTVPTNVLGTDYVVTRGYLDGGDEIYITAVADGTAIYQDGGATPLTTLAKGQSYTITLANASTFIHASQNIYVYQMTGNGCEVGSAIIPKIDCTGSQSVNIVRSNSDLFAVMITTRNGYQNNFTVNGNASLITAANFAAVPGTGGTYVSGKIDLSAAVTAGTAINFSNSKGPFSLGFINGGTNDGTVYGYFSDFKSLNVANDAVVDCQGDPVQLTAVGGVSYKWSPAAGLSNANIANPMASPAATTNYKVIITGTDGCVDSATVNVTVLPIKNVTVTTSICPGDSYKLPSGKVVNAAGTYTDIIPYKTGCDSLVTTLNLTITATPATPTVSIAASESSICAGTSVTFTATPVNGGATPSFQWQVNGANAGTNNSTFVSSTLANGDKISCTLTTAATTCATSANATSNTVTMSVSSNATPAVTIVASANNICAGTSVTFTATPAFGGTAPNYQWQVNGQNAGTNSATFSAATFANGDQVTCILTSNATCVTGASATSNSITMIVNPLVAPTISIMASASNICPATPVTFTATATNGGSTPTYQWLINGVNAGTNSPSFTTSSLSNGDVVSCRLTSDAPCLTTPTATSNVVNVTVSSPVVPQVSINVSANNVCAGTSVTFTAMPINGGTAPGYQWQINGNNAGTNSPTFTSNSLVSNDVVNCMMTSNAGCATPASVTSNNITMVVNPNLTPSVFIAASANSICPGAPLTFTATPVNAGPVPTFQWQVNGNNAGTNSSTFSASNFTNGDVVTCQLNSNATCLAATSATSNSITVSISPIVTPAVSIAASGTTICPGTGVTFTATPTNGGATPGYQWMVNGNNAGDNSPTFTTTTLANGDAVSCRLTGNAMCVTTNTALSNIVNIVVNPPTTPTVSIAVTNNNICSGAPLTYTATPTNGGPSPSYQWLVNGNDAGTDSPTFTSTTLANNDVVSCMIMSNATCATPASVTSNSITALIIASPVVNAGNDKTITSGGSVNLNATASGDITEITWSPATGLNNSTILDPIASPASTTTYSVYVKSTNGCAATSMVTITVLQDLVIPTSFTPNGDGVNDQWNIKNLSQYPNSSVQVFTRWGVRVYNSQGYSAPWDGTLDGKRLPMGTYYYVINLNNNTRPLSGFVVILR